MTRNKHGDISNIWPLDAFGAGQKILYVFRMFFLFWDPQEQDQIAARGMHGVDAGLLMSEKSHKCCH